MADFHIWGRIEMNGDAFIAIVSAVPIEPADIGRTIVIRKAARSRTDAVDVLRHQAIEIGQLLRANGDQVFDVEIE